MALTPEQQKIKDNAAKQLAETLLQGGIDKEPEFIKPYTLLTKPQIVINVNILLPVNVSANKSRELSSFQIFDEPYNNIQNLKFDPMNRKIELTFIDKTNDVGDMLLFSFLEQGRRGASGGAGMIEVEFGWRRPDNYNIPKRIEDKTQWTIKRIFTLQKPKYKFLPGMSGVEITLTGTANSISDLPNMEKAKPYYLLGALPLIEMVKKRSIFEFSRLFNALEGRTRGVSNLKLLADNSPVINQNKDLKTLKTILTKYHRVTGKDQMKKFLKAVVDFYKKNKDKFKLATSQTSTIPGTNGAPGSSVRAARNSEFASFNTQLHELYKKSITPSAEIPRQPQPLLFPNLTGADNFGQTPEEKAMFELISPLLGEYKIHPWNAFVYCYEAMKYQIISLQPGKVIPIMVEFLEGFKVDGVEDPQNGKKAIARSLENNRAKRQKELESALGIGLDDHASEFLLVKDIQINSGTSWESLFDMILSKMNFRVGEVKDLKGKTPLTGGSHMIYARGVGTGDSTKKSTIDDVVKNLKLLGNITDPGGNGNKTIADTIKKIASDKKDKDLLLTFISVKDPGVIFSNISLQNRVVNGYSYRPHLDSENRDNEFWSGRLALQENNFPDVLEFEPEFNFYEGAQAIIRNSQLNESVNLGSIKTTSDNEEKRKKDPIQTQDELEQKLQDEYISTRYKVSTNLFQQASFVTIGGQEGSSAQQAKNGLQNLRTRMAMTSLNVKAKLKILGEPSFVDTLVSNCYIFLRILNVDGTENFLTGLWVVVKVLSHDISGGTYTTTLEISRTKGNNTDNKLGYTNYVLNKDAQRLERNTLKEEKVNLVTKEK